MDETQLRKLLYEKLKIDTKVDSIERLSFEQLIFISHNIDSSCYLEACPGSGKTEVVGLKAAFELIDWQPNYSGIAIVSFTNIASNEIEKRARSFAGSKATSHPHFIGTLDSFFYKYILCPFFHKYVGFKGVNEDTSPRMIVDERSVADFLKNPKYQSKTRYAIHKQNPKTDEPFIGIPITANRFYFDIHKRDFYVLPPINKARKFSKLSDILNRSEQIAYHAKHSSWLTNQIITDGFKDAKKSFWSDGFLTFRDCEYLTYKILKDNVNIRKKLVKRFPYIIIDECQDLSPIQLTIISQLFLDGLKIHLIGDLNQSIYKFREVNPQLIQNFVANGNLIPLSLTNCYRSNQKIVNVFNNIFNNKFHSKQNQLLPTCLYIIEYEENEIPSLINRFNQLIKDVNNEANEEVVRINNSAIIIRGSSLLNKFKPYKTESNNPLTLLATSLQLWNNKEKNIEIIESSMKQFGRFISSVFYKNEGNSRNYYCPEKFTNSKWRLVLASLLNLTSKELYPFQTSNGVELTFGNWATKVRNYIPKLFNSLPIKSFVDISSITLRVETGKGQTLVSNLVTEYKSICNIRTTTIHEIKGETFDSAMVVSSLDRQSKGGYWKDWFNENPNNEDEYEYKRYGYVALSRPKHLLVLAMPYNNYERDFFTNLGFKIENLKQRSLF